MARVSAVTYGFTKNLGNFQSQKLEVTVEQNSEADDADLLIELAVAIVREAQDFDLTEREQQILSLYRETTLFIKAEAHEL